MKSFYEMLSIMEAEEGQEDQVAQGAPQGEEGLGDQEGSPEQQGGQQPQQGAEVKHYMFFANLKMIKEKAEAILAMDASMVDQMLGDGHDWASDHISTSRDDVEEVYNWLAGEMEGGSQPQQGGLQS